MKLPSMDAHFLLILLQFFLMAAISVGGQRQDSPPKAPPKRRLKVLVYSPSLSWSHAQFLGQLADTLQAAGHEVHFLKLLSEPNLRVRNETRLVQRIYRVEPKEGISEQLDISKLDMIQNTFAGNQQILTIFDHPVAAFGPNMALMCQEMIENTELLNRLAAEHFDVGIAELYDPCPAAILHRIGVRTKVAAYAVPLFPGMARQYGIPSFASYIPNMMAASSQMNFWMRAANFINEFYEWAWMDEFMMRLEEPLVRRAFGSDFPALKQLARNVSLAFFNSNPFFELPRPISSKIIHIGGIVDQQKAKGRQAALDSRTQHILDNARAGAILFSFGSIADTRGMGAQMRGAIRRAFARFPEVQFLWKLDVSSSQNDSAPLAALPNVHIFDWVRQSAVLSHPNLRAFISHCGQNSLSEAARAGVPVIGIPLFGDQPYNSLVAVQRGMATQLDVRQLNGPNAEAALVEALRKILHEPSYAQNARLIQRKLALTPFSPIDRFVRWVEFAAEFPEGLEELNLPGDEQIHWFVYYSLDVILASFAGALALCWAAWKIVSKILRQTTFVVRRIVDNLTEKKLIKYE